MTLNEKFDKATDGWIVADKCEKIADEFAIDFAEWLLKKYNGIKSVKEQLEIYKKEKEL
jgi:hypothetical protein